ncbi:hypothetical protein WA026_000367 [Henosepilachna vigintioctopunctata]|uniref:CAP-Gly domain-containing protein n=1 Tax=Henosepilachna vigintioctopunctata TaxID=420089 RepID=A0AAW1V3L6_9CUCU
MDIEGNAGSTGPYIETVRSLHQTVIALRSALEQSKKEVLELKSKAWPTESIEQSLTALAIENHALKRKLLSRDSNHSLPDTPEPVIEKEIDTIKTKSNNLINEKPALDTAKVQECQEITLLSNNTSEEINTIDKNILKSDIPNPIVIADNPLKVKETLSSALLPSVENAELFIEPSKVSYYEAKPIISKSERESRTQSKVSDEVSSKIQTHGLQKHENDIGKILPEKGDNKDIYSSANITTSVKTDIKKAKKEKHKIKNQVKLPLRLSSVRKNKIRASISIKAKSFDEKKVCRSLESLTVLKTPLEEVTLTKTTSFFDLSSKINCEISKKGSAMTDNKNCASKEKVENEEDKHSSSKPEEISENDVELEPEVDDIELIFTTDDTKESDFKEQLVSIDSIEGPADENALKMLAPNLECSLDISDRELDDDVFDTSFEHGSQEKSLQVHPLIRDNSELYNSKSDNSINQEEKSLRSYYSYQDSSFENKSLEKDESFDRFEERIRIVETDISKVGIQEVEYSGIRRNTCPNPVQYRPLLHREAITKGLNVKKSRPILVHSNAVRKESGAQTDISAIPGSAWRSESSLANKVHLGDNFTTLPSKYPLPGSRLKLSEKTSVEARRVLLSDIGFTSMVPELSRSADHLCPSTLKPPVTTYGQYLRTPELYSPAYTSQRFTWTTTTATPSDGSHTHSRYSIHPFSPPVQTRRCSAPVSPSRKSTFKSTTAKVRFANGSLPELRGDWTQLTADSGDSTDSLVEEAENYLRRSIDCILGGNKDTEYSESKRGTFRRASAPESTGDNIPPQGWQPFLPRQPRDLKLDHWVKVITPEGKVRGGRVRYIGPMAFQTDQFVGVQLAVPEGHSDGTYNTRRYFQCEPYHGIFVAFKKVIMGWRP